MNTINEYRHWLIMIPIAVASLYVYTGRLVSDTISIEASRIVALVCCLVSACVYGYLYIYEPSQTISPPKPLPHVKRQQPPIATPQQDDNPFGWAK